VLIKTLDFVGFTKKNFSAGPYSRFRCCLKFANSVVEMFCQFGLAVSALVSVNKSRKMKAFLRRCTFFSVEVLPDLKGMTTGNNSCSVEDDSLYRVEGYRSIYMPSWKGLRRGLKITSMTGRKNLWDITTEFKLLSQVKSFLMILSKQTEREAHQK